jgi:DNA-binding response OmpR family regulator
MDGFELARLLRQEKDRAGMRLVAVTGWGHESFRIRARESGFDDHLVKPVDPDALLGLIARFGQSSPV